MKEAVIIHGEVGGEEQQKVTSASSNGSFQITEQPKSREKFWLAFAVSTLAIIFVAAIRWSFAHPYGIHWDEALYLNDVGIDAQRLRSGYLLRLAGRLLLKSQSHPPAYRLIALPFLGLVGFHTVAARLVSLACFVASSGFVYLAARRIGSAAAGAFAVLIFCLSPEVVSASIFFGTDTSLYLATSALLYYLFASWTDTVESPRSWLGLGLAIGLGFLAKTSFIAILLPVLAFWIVADLWGSVRLPSLKSHYKAGVVALAVAGPWWVLNLRKAFEYAQYARGFVRNSLGPPSITTWGRWFNSVFQCLLGHGVGILTVLILITFAAKLTSSKGKVFDPFQTVALGACTFAGAPIVLAQLSGTNHLLRHISPAVVPLAIVIGVLADQLNWTRSLSLVALSGSLFCVQLTMIVFPVVFPNKHQVDLGFVNGAPPWRVMSRFDQWDWKPVQGLSDGCGLDSPRIAYLGGGRELNPPAIQFPRVEEIKSTHLATFGFPDVNWLWRYEDGSIDWGKVMMSADQSDVVLTAPNYVGETRIYENLDNRHNAEFADRLAKDPHFRGPIRITVGRFEPIEVHVFLNKALVCHSAS